MSHLARSSRREIAIIKSRPIPSRFLYRLGFIYGNDNNNKVRQGDVNISIFLCFLFNKARWRNWKRTTTRKRCIDNGINMWMKSVRNLWRFKRHKSHACSLHVPFLFINNRATFNKRKLCTDGERDSAMGISYQWRIYPRSGKQ